MLGGTGNSYLPRGSTKRLAHSFKALPVAHTETKSYFVGHCSIPSEQPCTSASSSSISHLIIHDCIKILSIRMRCKKQENGGSHPTSTLQSFSVMPVPQLLAKPRSSWQHSLFQPNREPYPPVKASFLPALNNSSSYIRSPASQSVSVTLSYQSRQFWLAVPILPLFYWAHIARLASSIQDEPHNHCKRSRNGASRHCHRGPRRVAQQCI